MKKSEKIQAISLIIYLIACVTTLALILVFRNIYTIIAFGLVLVVGYLFIHLLHSINYYYVCPKCKHTFKINILEDIFSHNGGKLGKKVECPSCGEKTYIRYVPI